MRMNVKIKGFEIKWRVNFVGGKWRRRELSDEDDDRERKKKWR